MKHRRNRPARSSRPDGARWMRRFWWSGAALMASSAALWYFEVLALPICAGLMGLGLALCIVSLIIEVRRKGMTADTAETLAQCIAMSFGVFGFFFMESTTALLIAVGGFLLFIFVGYGAQVWGKWGETKDLWHRFKMWRAGNDWEG